MTPFADEPTLRFIRDHADADVRQAALAGSKLTDIDLPFALDQIAGRQTARQKLPSWAATDGIVYPPHLAMEQCSSEATARYKGRIAAAGHTSLCDLTGGFGVDFAFMAQAVARQAAPAAPRLVYVEQQERLCRLARHNFSLLGMTADVVCGDGMDYLRQCDTHFGLIFIDPARRDSHGARTYGIADCTPNVLESLSLLTAKGDSVLLKLSPMLDWRKAVADLGRERVREVHIVSVKNECKELLILLAPGDGLRLCCANDGQLFEEDLSSPEAATLPPVPAHGGADAYLFEPNASVMKAGCFGRLARRFAIAQLAPNSHLFVAAAPVEGFPGRQFAVRRQTTMNKRELKAALHGVEQANITTRNFPMTAAQLRQRLRLRDGGDCYIFATTLDDGTHSLFVCDKAS